MSFLTAEQMIAAHKSNVEALFGLSHKTFEGFEKLVDLNMQAARTSMGELTDSTRAALSAKDVQELMAVQAALLQPNAEKAVAYGRHVYDIATATNAEMTKMIEATLEDAQVRLNGLVDAAAKNAPAGTENTVALVRSMMAAANNTMESVQKAAKQAADAAEANLQAMSSTVQKTSKARKAA